MSRVELGVAADEVTDDLRAIYADLRRFAAVVAPVEVEPDDLLQDAVVRVLTSGTWSRVHDLPSYLRRTIVDAAPVVRGSPQPATATERPASEITLISTYPAGLSELTRQGPMARGLLFLVDVEDYLVDEAAVMVGCTPTAALDQLSRARKRIHGDDVRDHLEAMSLRGQVRGVEEVVRSAFDEVADRRAAGEAARPRRPHWRVVVAVSVAVVLVGVLVAFSRRDSGKAHGVADASRSSDAETTPASPRTTFAPTARGWIFDEGVLRDVQDGHQVAAFPMKVAEAPPVRVEGGFVAVLADHNLWFAKELSTESMQLDRLVSGVAASPGGTSIAYATVAGDGRSATLKLVDVATKSLIAQLAVDRFARVVGYSNPEVLLDTGDGAASSAALWDPTGPNRLTFLDAFGTVGGVGRNVAVLRQGDGTCPALVTVRNGAIVPLRNVDLSAGESGCDASRWEFDPSGALVAGFGMIGAPAPIRVSVNRFPVAIGTRRVIAGMWVDSANIAAIDERGQLVTCDVSARCTDVRLVRPQPIAPQSIWMVAPRRDVADDRVVTSTPDTMTPSYLTAVQMVSPSVAFAAGPSAFLRSDDGGRSWQRMAPCRDPLNPCPVNVEHLDMLDASTGWATTNDGLFRTVDGHEWFRARAEGIEHGLAIVHFVSVLEGWGVDGTFGNGEFVDIPDGRVVHTTDGGNTWTPVANVDGVQSVCFVEPDDGWLVTRTAVHRSSDGGRSWHSSYATPAGELQNSAVVVLQCGGPNAAWVQFTSVYDASPSNPHLLVSSSDAGEHWTVAMRSQSLSEIDGPDAPGTAPGPFSVIDPTTAVVVSNNPSGAAATAVLVTDAQDLGDVTALPTHLTPISVSFADRDHGVVVGYAPSDGGPLIYATDDGGGHWTPASS